VLAQHARLNTLDEGTVWMHLYS